jgi:hypothetical protein
VQHEQEKPTHICDNGVELVPFGEQPLIGEKVAAAPTLVELEELAGPVIGGAGVVVLVKGDAETRREVD